MNYDDMLERGKEMSSETVDDSRFEVPSANIITEGNKTILKNFSNISDKLRRDRDHMMKFLTKELAVSGDQENSRAVFQGKFTKDQVEEKIEDYVNSFVLCPACGKSDTKLVVEERVTKIKCEACGTKQVIEQL